MFTCKICYCEFEEGEMSEDVNICQTCYEDAEEDEETTMLVALDII